MNRLELVKNKFPQHYQQALEIKDPSGSKHKYLLWIASQLARGHNSPDISATLKYFDENIDKFSIKDIYKYQDLKDLESLVKEFGISNRQVSKQEKEYGTKIFEDENMLIIRADDKNSIIRYGAHTKWCVTMETESYFEDYTIDGNIFYILICKNKKLHSKYAIVKQNLYNLTIYDDQDDKVDDVDTEEQRNIFKTAIAKVISDSPPPNYLEQILHSDQYSEEVVNWLRKQHPSTLNYVLRENTAAFIEHMPAVDILNSKEIRRLLTRLTPAHERKLNEIVEFYLDNKNPKYEASILSIISVLSTENKLKLYFHGNSTVRVGVTKHLSIDDIKKHNILKDRSVAVIKVAANLFNSNDLVELLKTSKLARQRTAIRDTLIQRLLKCQLHKCFSIITTELMIDIFTEAFKQ
jgi:hypothetical protein